MALVGPPVELKKVVQSFFEHRLLAHGDLLIVYDCDRGPLLSLRDEYFAFTDWQRWQPGLLPWPKPNEPGYSKQSHLGQFVRASKSVLRPETMERIKPNGVNAVVVHLPAVFCASALLREKPLQQQPCRCHWSSVPAKVPLSLPHLQLKAGYAAKQAIPLLNNGVALLVVENLKRKAGELCDQIEDKETRLKSVTELCRAKDEELWCYTKKIRKIGEDLESAEAELRRTKDRVAKEECRLDAKIEVLETLMEDVRSHVS